MTELMTGLTGCWDAFRVFGAVLTGSLAFLYFRWFYVNSQHMTGSDNGTKEGGNDGVDRTK